MEDKNLTLPKKGAQGVSKSSVIKTALKKDLLLYLLLILPIAYFIIFKYLPMYGIVLSFRHYKPGGSMIGDKWMGFTYFKLFLKDPTFWNVFKNTVVLSFSALIIGFPFPIIFALLLNEVRNTKAKRFIQTATYLPRFLSTVVVAAMIRSMLSPSSGIVNQVIQFFGGESIYFIMKKEWFRPIYIISDIWQFMGWSAIIYIAALSGVDEQLYEAAHIDGAGRWKQTLHVTIPGILPTIMITLILNVGNTLQVGFEKVLMLYNRAIYDVADILQTYIYRMAFEKSTNYSLATAIGLFQALISLTLLWITNTISKKFTEYSLW